MWMPSGYMLMRRGNLLYEGKDNNNDGLLDLLAGCRMGFQNNVPHRENYTYFVPYKDYLLINTYNNDTFCVILRPTGTFP